MNSLYTNEIRSHINAQPWPSGLIYEVIEQEDCLKFKLYRDNINRLNGEDKLHLAKLVNQTLSAISKAGVPIFTWVEKGNGHGQE